MPFILFIIFIVFYTSWLSRQRENQIVEKPKVEQKYHYYYKENEGRNIPLNEK